MTRACDFSGTKALTGNNVSKSNRKTRRIFAPNLQVVTLKSDILKKTFQVKVSTRTLRTITKYGSLDEYLLHTKAQNMTAFGAKLKYKLKKDPTVANKMKDEAETKKAKRVIKPSARSLIKKNKTKKTA